MKKIICSYVSVSIAIGLILLNITQILGLAVSKKYSVSDVDSYKELAQIQTMVLYDYKTMFNILIINIFFILLYHLIVQRKKYTILLLVIHIIFIVTLKLSDYLYESLTGSETGLRVIKFNYITVFYILCINNILYIYLIFNYFFKQKSSHRY